MSERKTAVQRERDGAWIGGAGLVVALAGLGLQSGAVIVIGVIAAVIGGLMWVAGMARSH